VSTPYGYQPDPDQGGQGGPGGQYDATQFAPAPQFGQGGQQAQPGQPQAQQYGQPAPQYGQSTPQYGQSAQPQYGQSAPAYGQSAPQYGQSPPQYGQAPAYGQSTPQYGQATPQYGQAPAYGQATPQYGQSAPQYGSASQYGTAQPQYGQAGYSTPAGAYGPYPAGMGATPAAPGTYLAGAPVSFGQAVTEGLRNTFTWQGRASRSAYWWLALATGVVNFILYLILVNSGSIGLFAFGFLIMFAIGLPNLGALVRRLHDTGRSGWYYWMSLIPIVGPILLLIALCEAPAPGPNQYG
jgi:uncharacterized membrane protein YhaH (DUF805 family)